MWGVNTLIDCISFEQTQPAPTVSVPCFISHYTYFIIFNHISMAKRDGMNLIDPPGTVAKMIAQSADFFHTGKSLVWLNAPWSGGQHQHPCPQKFGVLKRRKPEIWWKIHTFPGWTGQNWPQSTRKSRQLKPGPLKTSQSLSRWWLSHPSENYVQVVSFLANKKYVKHFETTTYKVGP